MREISKEESVQSIDAAKRYRIDHEVGASRDVHHSAHGFSGNKISPPPLGGDYQLEEFR